MEDDFEFDLDAELLQEQQLREEMEMDVQYLEQQAQEHEMMAVERDPTYAVQGGRMDHLEEGDEPEASGALLQTPLHSSLTKRPRLESPTESPYKCVACFTVCCESRFKIGTI
jgi:hypothetical protein